MTLGSIEKLKKSWYFSFKARVKSALPHHSLLSHFHLFCLALCTPFSGFLSVPEASQAPSCCQKRSFLKSLPTQFLLILEEPGETSPQRVLSYYFLLCPSYSPSQLNCFFLDSCYNTQLIYLLVSILFFFFLSAFLTRSQASWGRGMICFTCCSRSWQSSMLNIYAECIIKRTPSFSCNTFFNFWFWNIDSQEVAKLIQTVSPALIT